MRKNLLAIVFMVICPQLVAQQALNNDSVIRLVKAGLSEDLIVTTISGAAGNYDISADGIIALKTAGVSDKVVAAIVAKASAPASASASVPALVTNNPDDPTQVHSPGIYILAAGLDKSVHLKKLDHVVPKQAKSSGTLAMAFTYGIKKAHELAVLDGPKASIQTPDTNPTFYAYIPEDNTTFGGSSITVKDFALIKFDVKGQQRQANIATVGLASASA